MSDSIIENEAIKLLGWVKPIFLSMVIASFAFGGWVATIQLTQNAIADRVRKIDDDLERREEWTTEQRKATTELQTELRNIKDDIKEIKTLLEEKR